MILVAGSANLDFVVRAAHIPAPGETVMGHSFATFAGGKGANQAYACAHAGNVATHMLLALGADSHAAAIETSLQRAGVHLHVVRMAQVATGSAFICVADNGENAITVAPGANAELKPRHLPDLQGFSHLLLQLETPLDTVTDYARAAHAAGLCVVLNAAPAQALPPELLQHIDLLLVNETELQTVAQHKGAVDECLRRIGVHRVVVTLGARGSCALDNGTLHHQSGFAVEPVDTTGAGDTFCGSLCAQLSLGHDLPTAMRYASAAAALACTAMGAQPSMPSAAQVQEFLRARATSTPQL